MAERAVHRARVRRHLASHAIVAGARVTKGGRRSTTTFHRQAGARSRTVFERVERRASLVVHEQVKDEQPRTRGSRPARGLRAFLVVVRDPTLDRRAGVVTRTAPPVLGYERYREQEERSTFATVLDDRDLVAGRAGRRVPPGDPDADEPMRHTFARIFFGAMSSAGESVSLAEDPEAAADRVEAAIGRSSVIAGCRSLAEAPVVGPVEAAIGPPPGETPTSAR